MKIYLASSWRNVRQPKLVETLRGAGHDVYDFRNPRPGVSGFAWSDIDPDWQLWSPEQFKAALEDPIAKVGFGIDFEAMQWADAFVLLMPCGRSAHLEAGWAIGAGKPTAILLSDGEPELMYRLAGEVVTSVSELIAWCERWEEWGDGPKPSPEAIDAADMLTAELNELNLKLGRAEDELAIVRIERDHLLGGEGKHRWETTKNELLDFARMVAEQDLDENAEPPDDHLHMANNSDAWTLARVIHEMAKEARGLADGATPGPTGAICSKCGEPLAVKDARGICVWCDRCNGTGISAWGQVEDELRRIKNGMKANGKCRVCGASEAHDPLCFVGPLLGEESKCRRCSECVGEDHHWLDDVDDEGQPILRCKHCPATKPWEDLDETPPASDD